MTFREPISSIIVGPKAGKGDPLTSLENYRGNLEETQKKFDLYAPYYWRFLNVSLVFFYFVRVFFGVSLENPLGTLFPELRLRKNGNDSNYVVTLPGRQRGGLGKMGSFLIFRVVIN